MNIILEWVGAVTGLLSVWLTVRQKIICWPIGLLSVLAFGCLFANIKLYADMGLQGIFFVTGLYGWWAWARGGERGAPLRMTRLTFQQRWIGALVMVPVIFIVGSLLNNHTDSSLPFWDTTVSILSVVAQLLLIRKIYESWWLWITVDILSIGLYAVKDVWLTAALYLVFLILAGQGWLTWRRHLLQTVKP